MGGADELRKLAADLAKGVPLDKARSVLEDSATTIKGTLRAEAGRSRHFKIAPTITHDVRYGLGSMSAEIGPTKVGAGRLANIAYFGGSNGGGGTLPDPRGALDAEAPTFIRALSDLADGVL